MLVWIAVFVTVSLGIAIIVRALLKQRPKEQKQINSVTLETHSQLTEAVLPTEQEEMADDVLPPQNNHVQTSNDATEPNMDLGQSYQKTIEMFVFPKDEAVIEGLDIISLMSYYSMLYDTGLGVFYRYDNDAGKGEPWFGMIGMYDGDFQRFDLNELSKKRYSCLAFFVSLPHSQPLSAFDAMTQIVSMIANQLSADVYYKDTTTHELLPVNDVWINISRASLQD